MYANKAPGLSLLAVPAYAMARAVETIGGVDPSSSPAMTLNLYLCGVATCGVAGALLAALLFLHLERRGAPRATAVALALAFAFGTYLFAYSTVFFAHVPAALFLFWSFSRLMGDGEDRPWVGGALGGAAVLCNYASLPALAVIAVAAIAAPGPRMRRAFGIVAGGAPFAAALLAYQTVCFGSPFRTAVEATSGVFLTKGAFLGVFVVPRAGVLAALLVSRYRGILFLSPFLVLAFAGFVISIRQKRYLLECATAAGALGAFLLVGMSFNNWDGGSSIGPRYILPAVPLLATPVALAWSLFPRLRQLLVALSIVFNFAVAAVNPLPSRLIADPIFRYTFPLLLTGRLPASTPPLPPVAWKQMLGHVSVNRVTADEMVAFMKHAPGTAASEWASFNVGETFAEGSVISLVPIALWMACGSWILARRAGRA